MDLENKIVAAITRLLVAEDFALIADTSHQPNILDIAKTRILRFQLNQRNGTFVELHLTIYRGPDLTNEQNVAYILVAPIVHMVGQRVAFEPSFFSATVTDNENDEALAQMLKIPVNQIKNSVSPFIRILKNDEIRGMLLRLLNPVAVARLEQVSVPARTQLLSPSVDQTFWKQYYIREFGTPLIPSTSTASITTYRKQYFAEQTRRKNEAEQQLRWRFSRSPSPANVSPIRPRGPAGRSTPPPPSPPHAPYGPSAPHPDLYPDAPDMRRQPSPHNPYQPQPIDPPPHWPPRQGGPPDNPFAQPDIFPDPTRPPRDPTRPTGDPTMPWQPRPGKGGGGGGPFGGGFGGGGGGGFGGII